MMDERQRKPLVKLMSSHASSSWKDLARPRPLNFTMPKLEDHWACMYQNFLPTMRVEGDPTLIRMWRIRYLIKPLVDTCKGDRTEAISCTWHHEWCNIEGIKMNATSTSNWQDEGAQPIGEKCGQKGLGILALIWPLAAHQKQLENHSTHEVLYWGQKTIFLGEGFNFPD